MNHDQTLMTVYTGCIYLDETLNIISHSSLFQIFKSFAVMMISVVCKPCKMLEISLVIESSKYMTY